MIAAWRQAAVHQVARVQGLMAVLMKPRNGVPWTAEDRAFLRAGLRKAATMTPGILLFLLPGGMLLLPLYAWFIDRRRAGRRPPSERAS